MNADFTAIIQTLVAEQGKGALVDPAKCKAFLPDYTKSEYVKERRLLLKVVETGAAREIAVAASLDNCKKQQIQHLKEDLFMAEDIAAGVVDLLAFVLRGDARRTTLEVSKPALQKPKEASATAVEPQKLHAPKPAPQKPKETLYTVSVNYQQSGPFSLEQLQNMIGSGGVSKDYRIRPADGTDWMPIAVLPELKSFFEDAPQPTSAIVPKPDESKGAKSEYKRSLGYRILRTGILAVLGIGLWMMRIHYWTYDTIIVALFIFGIFLDGIWEKSEYKHSLGYRILRTGILAVLVGSGSWMIRLFSLPYYYGASAVLVLLSIFGIFLDGIWEKSEHKHSLRYRILWTCILAVLCSGASFFKYALNDVGGGGAGTIGTVLVLFIFCIFLDRILARSEYKHSLGYRVLWTCILAVLGSGASFIIWGISWGLLGVGGLLLVLFIIFCVFFGGIWAKKEE
jgi:hypothetical protein